MTNKEKLEKMLKENDGLFYYEVRHARSFITEILKFLIEKEEQEAQQNDEIKVGDVVYYCCLYHNKIQIRKGKLLNVIETGNTYVIKRNKSSQTDHISYGYRAKIFKTESELIESLRGWDE